MHVSHAHTCVCTRVCLAAVTIANASQGGASTAEEARRGRCRVPRVSVEGWPCTLLGALTDHLVRIQVHGHPPASLLITGRGKGPGQ